MKGLLESLPLGPRVRSLGDGFQAVHMVCSQSGSSSQLHLGSKLMCVVQESLPGSRMQSHGTGRFLRLLIFEDGQ